MHSEVKTTSLDPASLCRTDEEQENFLNAAWETGNPSVIANALSIIARARKGGVNELAKETDLARSTIYKALSKDGNPRLKSLLSLFRDIGIETSFSLRKS
ncbi:addiction module antidote protein [Sorlinia euscelidii]